VLGAERYNGANWPEVQIADDRIAWKPNTWPLQTNWTALVARGVDEAGGQGFVTELAGSTEPLTQLLDSSMFQTPEDEQAGAALRALIGDAPYLTRLYSRLSAEEMTSDPIFRRDAGSDVSNVHMLSRHVDGVDLCPEGDPVPFDPCLFTSCGAGGICRPVRLDGADAKVVAGCGCLAGSTARTTFDPSSIGRQAADGPPAATVVCQDARMSFMNPGDVAASGGAMTDPCQSFDCGPNGECLAVNMTPTCVCDRGFVALGSFAADGTRSTRCEQPMLAVPDAFYAQRLPDLPTELPGGRVMAVDPMLPVIEPSMDDLGSMGMPVPGGAADGPASDPGRGDDGAPGSVDESGDGSCGVSAPGAGRGGAFGLLWLALAWCVRRQRRR
jgi:MYXO-CTERM domain-containing protein